MYSARAERLLVDWANLSGPWPIENVSKGALLKLDRDLRRLQSHYKDILGDSSVVGHPWLRDMLRRAWGTNDMREREWLCFKFRDAYASMVRHHDMSIEEIRAEEQVVDVSGPRYDAPPVSPLEAALFHFQHLGNRAKRCLNPECAEPYFVVSRKGQEYCSSTCATHAKRFSKLNWWHQNKDSLKKKQKKRAAPMRSTSKRR